MVGDKCRKIGYNIILKLMKEMENYCERYIQLFIIGSIL